MVGVNGAFYGNPAQLISQVRAIAYAIVWSGLVTWLLFKPIDRVIGVRASPEAAILGLDLAEQSQLACEVSRSLRDRELNP